MVRLLVPELMEIHVEQGGASVATRTPKAACRHITMANLGLAGGGSV